MSKHEDLPAALAAFEVTLEEDLRRGPPASASEYAARFPGFESHIERAYQCVVQRWQQARGADDPALPPPLGPGTRFGPYCLENELGRGGQGTVFAAEDTRVRRRVAIKVLDRLGPVPADTLRRFAREAAIVSRLDHPGLCALFDTGDHAGTPFLVMRHIEGEPLARWLARAREGTGFLAPPTRGSGSGQRRGTVLTLVEAVARALHEAHEAGVVHRDVKPGNVMITPDGAPVVLDFGLARDERDEGLTLTRSGDTLGTPSYMAPEQLAGSLGPVDRRTDVWGLGVVLYECLTLQRPFSAPTTAGLCRAVLNDPLPATRALGAPHSRDLEVVLATALERDRSRRYQTALDFAEDLHRILHHEPIRARPAGPWLRSRRWIRRHPGRAAGAALALLVLATIAAASGYLAARQPLLELGTKAARAERLESALCEGFLATWNNELSRGASVFAAVLADDPGEAEAIAGLALTRARSAGKPEAVAMLGQTPQALASHAALRRLRSYLHGAAEDAAALPADSSALDHFVAALIEVERARDRCDRKLAERALDLITAAILRSRTAPMHYLVLRGSVSGFTGRRAEVGRETAAILESIWSDRPAATYWAGVAWRDIDPRRAAACFARALQRDPDDERSAYRLSMQLALSGEGERALAAAEEFVRRKPHLATSHEALARVHDHANRFEQAATAARAALRIDPSLAIAYLMCATASLETGDVAAARATLDACLRAVPGDSVALSQLAMIEDQASERDEALALYGEALRRDPFMPVVWWNMGVLLSQLGRRHEAHAAGARALEMGSKRWMPATADSELAGTAEFVKRIDRKLLRIAGNADLAAGDAGLIELAEAASFHAQWSVAAALWARALVECEPAPAGVSLRTRAARAALQVGDEPWRELARRWLAEQLKDWRAAQEAGTLEASRVARRIARWQSDPVLVPALPDAVRPAAR